MVRYTNQRFNKSYKKKGGYRKPRQAKWKQVLKLGKSIYQNYKGPLGYAIKGVNMLKNLVNTESKYIDTAVFTAQTITTTGSVSCLSAVAQGTTDITRIGNSILAKHLQIRYVVQSNTVSHYNALRMILFLDKQNAKGTIPAASEILNGVSINGFINKDNTDRFVILKDDCITVDDVGDSLVTKKEFLDLSRLHIKYDGTTAAQGDLAENHIYMLLVSADPTDGPSISMNSRLVFYDN